MKSIIKDTIKKNRGIVHEFRKIKEINQGNQSPPFHQQVIFYLYCLRLLCRKKSYNFESVQTVVLTIGFARSGSSLIGYLLTAHPNIIMPDEPRVHVSSREQPHLGLFNLQKRPTVRCLYEADLNEMFNYLVHLEWQRYIFGTSILRRNKSNNLVRSPFRIGRYILVPNQSQGRFESLKVIGAKESRENTKALAKGDLLKNLKRKLKERKISLKFIFALRNPKDIIATDLRETVDNNRKSKDITKYIEKMAIFCKQNKKILQQVDRDDVFISRNEDIISRPREHLSKLCDFLQVDASTDYLDACASKIIARPIRSRLEIDWSQEHKRKIASLIEDYDFFRGYD